VDVQEKQSRRWQHNHALGQSYAHTAVRVARQTQNPAILANILMAVTDDLRCGKTTLALGLVHLRWPQLPFPRYGNWINTFDVRPYPSSLGRRPCTALTLIR
jgi:hypothetical protein